MDDKYELDKDMDVEDREKVMLDHRKFVSQLTRVLGGGEVLPEDDNVCACFK